MKGESQPTPEPDVNPFNELIALHFEREAMGWLTSPAEYHPLSGAIDNGAFGTLEQRVEAVTGDAKDVADYLMEFAEAIRRGEKLDRAFFMLQRSARFDKEAFELMQVMDPEAKPWYPDQDANGDRVAVGKRYRYNPGPDNRGNEPGYHVEGTVIRVENDAVFAVWEEVGEANPEFWGRQQRSAEMTDEERVEELLLDIEEKARETFYFAEMLTPIETEEIEEA